MRRFRREQDSYSVTNILFFINISNFIAIYILIFCNDNHEIVFANFLVIADLEFVLQSRSSIFRQSAKGAYRAHT